MEFLNYLFYELDNYPYEARLEANEWLALNGREWMKNNDFLNFS